MTNSSDITKMPRIYTVRKRGKYKGYVLTPHKNKDGHFVVSMTRFSKDYLFVTDESELREWINAGYSLRMSNTLFDGTKGPSLISPESINFTND